MLILFCVYIFFLINGYCCVSQIGCSNNSPVGIVNWLKRLYPSSSGREFHHAENKEGFKVEQYTSPMEASSRASISSSERVIQSRSSFFMKLSKTDGNGCIIKKIFGGRRWQKGVRTDGTILHPGGASEGDKMLCVDNMIHDITHGTCLVYSFGIADDWTFEISMASLGCKVCAFDPTIDVREGHMNFTSMNNEIIFSKVGLSAVSGANKNFGNLHNSVGVTLEDAMKRTGDEGRSLTVLKLDVEGEEFKSVPQMLSSNMFDDIKQVHLEIHADEISSWKYSGHEYLTNFKKSIQKLTEDKHVGHRLIYYAPNLLLERAMSKDKHYYSYFDVVLYKGQ